MVRDIREGPPETYWQRLRDMMGPSGLVTYWYLGRAVNQLVDPGTMVIRRDMRNAVGGLMAAPLAIAAPETGGWRDRDVVPAPVTYALHVIDPGVDVIEIGVRRFAVRQGSKTGFSRSEIFDVADPDRLIAITAGVGVKLGVAPPNFEPIDLPPSIPDSADLPPLHVVFGAERHAEGWRLPPLGPTAASTSASLHLGPIHVAFEAAAIEEASRVSGVDQLQIEDWNVHFVAPGRTGPFLITAAGHLGSAGRVAIHLTMIDEGNGGISVASGEALFRQLSTVQ